MSADGSKSSLFGAPDDVSVEGKELERCRASEILGKNSLLGLIGEDKRLSGKVLLGPD